MRGLKLRYIPGYEGRSPWLCFMGPGCPGTGWRDKVLWADPHGIGWKYGEGWGLIKLDHDEDKHWAQFKWAIEWEYGWTGGWCMYGYGGWKGYAWWPTGWPAWPVRSAALWLCGFAG